MEQCEKHGLEVCEPCAYDRGASCGRQQLEALREKCAQIAESEPEMEGSMPPENYEAALKESLATGVGMPEVCARAAVRAVRESIAKKIRSS